MGPNAANVNEQRTDIVAKRKKKEENKRIAGKTTSKRSKAFRRGNLSYHGSSCEKMKVVLALILVAASMVTCEDAPSKDEGKDKFATKKEVEEQKADLEAKLREEFRKKLNEEIAKVKVANSNLRKADADILRAEAELRRADKEEEAENSALRKQIAKKQSTRQADVLIETKKLIRAEINSEETKKLINGEISTYLDANSVCQIGNQCDGKFTNYRGNWRPFTSSITFRRKFSKKPRAEVALRSVQWSVDLKAYIAASLNPMLHAFATVGSVTTTGMKISIKSQYSAHVQYICATWIACV